MADRRNHSTQKAIRLESVQRLLDSGLSFALFRLPQPSTCDTSYGQENKSQQGDAFVEIAPKEKAVTLVLQTEGEACTIDTTSEVTEGFIFAPFRQSKACTTLLIRPDVVARGWDEIALATKNLPLQKPRLSQLRHRNCNALSATESALYEKNFHRQTSLIKQGKFEKLVLSYCQSNAEETLLGQEAEAFLSAIERYPHALTYLLYTPKGGRWMGCTPELLLERKGQKCHTMALAGTHKQTEKTWDNKNILEQDVVCRYVEKTLQTLGVTSLEKVSSNLQIGDLQHICSDFYFTADKHISTTDLLLALHPTPAVCGMPKEEAYRFLTTREGSCRNYFSGYLGIIGADNKAHIYVNLRCAQICQHCTYYHAGGGITPLSRLEDEQQEIVNKMQILKSLLN